MEIFVELFIMGYNLAVPNCHECRVKDCSLLRHCSYEWLSRINDNKIYVRVKQGEQVLLEGTPAMGIFFLEQGKVKIPKRGMNGKSFILRLGKPGDILGDCGIAKKQMYPFSVTALEDSYCCFIENALFAELLKNCSGLVYEMMMYYSDELRAYEHRMVRLVQMNVREKVADTLLFLRDYFGEAPASLSIDISLSRQDLADISGTTKEQISKTLSEFSADGLIQTEGKQIRILKSDRLLAIASV